MCGGGNTGVMPSWTDPAGVSKWGGGTLDPLHLYGNPGQDAADAAAKAAELAETKRQQQIKQTIAGIDKYFDSAAMQKEYADYRNNTYNFLKAGLDTGYRDNNRNLNFGLVRSGNLGGSEDIAQHGRLTSDYNTGIVNAENQAQGAESSLKGADEQLRSSLYQDALSGLSATTTTQQAIQGAEANLGLAKSLQGPMQIDQIFGDLSQAYTQGKIGQGQNAANGRPQPSGNGGGVGSYFPSQATNPNDVYQPDAGTGGI